MKKFFFFKSSSSSNTNKSEVVRPPAEFYEPERRINGRGDDDKVHESFWSSKGVIREEKNSSHSMERSSPRLVRSYSFSSAAFDTKANDQFPSSLLTPERPQAMRKNELSENSSSDRSTRAFDVYVDGEDQSGSRKRATGIRKYPPRTRTPKENPKMRSRTRSFSDQEASSCIPDSSACCSADEELQAKYEGVKERASSMCQEMDDEYFTPDSILSMPALIRTIRNLIEERKRLAVEVSDALLGRIKDRASSIEKLRLQKEDTAMRIRKLEREMNELHNGLERELDRRSREWSEKLDRSHKEEQRLHSRVRELAEQNVSLQRDLSSCIEKQGDHRIAEANSKNRLDELTEKNEFANRESRRLEQELKDTSDRLLRTEEERNCFKRNYEEKETECGELHESVCRLLRTCREQEKTIEGLLARNENADGKRLEHLRLIGVEQRLRRELESRGVEVESLRKENIGLLKRIAEPVSVLRLEAELQSRVSCLANNGMSLLDESARLSYRLLDALKRKGCAVEREFMIDCDVKAQSLKRGTESLQQSLNVTSGLVQETAGLTAGPTAGDSDRELKAEMLVTRALRDKIYSKETDIERLQAEVAAAVRGSDVLRSENQNLSDAVSCLAHKLKDSELQMMKKEEGVKGLENELQEKKTEFVITNGVLLKVSEQRDELWKEVKKLSEQKMLLSSEVDMLKKKVESLDEDVHVREGQITILKDSLSTNLLPTHSYDFSSDFLVS